LVEKSEEKRPLGRPKRRYKDNIRMDVRDIDWEGVEWTRLAQDKNQRPAVVNRVRNLRVT